MKKLSFLFFCLMHFSVLAYNSQFVASKKVLERNVYNTSDMRRTLYCDVVYNDNKSLELPDTLLVEKYKNRQNRIEWEHVVPQSKLKSSGNEAIADMYNLYPAIGSVNARRSNFEFDELSPAMESTFGSCNMKMHHRLAEPPVYAKGNVARAYLYMAEKYLDFSLTAKQLDMFYKWSQLDPVDESECKRTQLIELAQGNENNVVKPLCQQALLWSKLSLK